MILFTKFQQKQVFRENGYPPQIEWFLSLEPYIGNLTVYFDWLALLVWWNPIFFGNQNCCQSAILNLWFVIYIKLTWKDHILPLCKISWWSDEQQRRYNTNMVKLWIFSKKIWTKWPLISLKMKISEIQKDRHKAEDVYSHHK